MKIALTGGSGAIGQVLAAHLCDQGHELISLDRVECGSLPCPELVLSLNDYQATHDALKGCNAVVHFGANPFPDENHEAAADRFANNTVSTYNVFNAAMALGINRVVWASSETVYGYPFADIVPPSVPLTEEMVQPQTGYAISKIVSEDIAHMLCALNPEATFVGLRLSNILYAEALPTAQGKEQPANRQRDTYRRLPEYWGDVHSREFNLWGYIDARDVCSAVELALTVDLKGAHACAIVADETLMDRPTRELVEERFPGTPIDPRLAEFGGAVSNEHARELLGWAPQWSWRDIPEVFAADQPGKAA